MVPMPRYDDQQRYNCKFNVNYITKKCHYFKDIEAEMTTYTSKPKLLWHYQYQASPYFTTYQ